MIYVQCTFLERLKICRRGNYSRAETNQGRKLFAEIRYSQVARLIVFSTVKQDSSFKRDLRVVAKDDEI